MNREALPNRPAQRLLQKLPHVSMFANHTFISSGSHKHMNLKLKIFILLLFSIGVVAACQPDQPQEQEEIRVELQVDGARRTYAYDRAVSVGQFLQEVEVQVSPLDRVNPPQFTQITDGITITVVRVREERECREETLAFEEVTLRTSDLEPGERTVAEEGENGLIEICERVIYENDVAVSRTEILPSLIVQEPRDQIVYIGVANELDPVPVDGSLAYISGGQAYLIQNSSTRSRPLTTEGGLDGRAFALSSNGRQLLYTRATPDTSDEPFANELWVILDTATPNPIKTPLTNILSASWQPDNPFTITYTTARAGGGSQGWDAFNDLFVARLNDQTGEIINVEQIVPNNYLGLYAYWGTRFVWSPDGTQVAYAKADGVGLVDLETGEFAPFALSFPYYNSAIQNGWVWQPTLSWSQDSRWVVTTVHGAPYGPEQPIDSVIFDVGVFSAEGDLAIQNLIKRAGIWSNPVYSPVRLDADNVPSFQIAYLQARDPLNSYGTGYDLMVADRDGSNPRRVFPAETESIRPVTQRSGGAVRCFDGEFTWSPTGRQIAIIYQCNLWVVDVESGFAQQLTSDGRASFPVWVP